MLRRRGPVQLSPNLMLSHQHGLRAKGVDTSPHRAVDVLAMLKVRRQALRPRLA